MFISKRKRLNLEYRIMTLEAENTQIRKNLAEAKSFYVYPYPYEKSSYNSKRAELIPFSGAIHAIMDFLGLQFKKEPEQFVAVKTGKEHKK